MDEDNIIILVENQSLHFWQEFFLQFQREVQFYGLNKY